MKIQNSSRLVGIALVSAFAAIFAGPAVRAAALPDPAIDETRAGAPQTAVFAGGCFWGIQAVFEHVNGVTSATSGYTGGQTENPTYDAVSAGSTGHAESVKVVYDPAKVSYGQLLKIFFAVAHDPTQLNRQGPDVGSQYRSAIFVSGAQQERIARGYVQQLSSAGSFSHPIVTEIKPLGPFYTAESYHQDYAKTHPDSPYIMLNDLPKVAHLKAEFPALYRTY